VNEKVGMMDFHTPFPLVPATNDTPRFAWYAGMPKIAFFAAGLSPTARVEFTIERVIEYIPVGRFYESHLPSGWQPASLSRAHRMVAEASEGMDILASNPLQLPTSKVDTGDDGVEDMFASLELAGHGESVTRMRDALATKSIDLTAALSEFVEPCIADQKKGTPPFTDLAFLGALFSRLASKGVCQVKASVPHRSLTKQRSVRRREREEHDLEEHEMHLDRDTLGKLDRILESLPREGGKKGEPESPEDGAAASVLGNVADVLGPMVPTIMQLLPMLL